MEIGLARVPFEFSDSDVVYKLIPVLHSEEFSPPPPARKVNFKVKLDYPEEGVRHAGTGILIVPDDIVHKFLSWVKDNPIKPDGKNDKIKFYIKGPAKERWAKIIAKTPFIDPALEEKRKDIIWTAGIDLRVDAVQFGILFREKEKYPSNDKDRLGPRSFSIEWEHDAIQKSAAYLRFVYEHKLIRIAVRKSSH
jgi:RNA-dependent RNA polymerase